MQSGRYPEKSIEKLKGLRVFGPRLFYFVHIDEVKIGYRLLPPESLRIRKGVDKKNRCLVCLYHKAYCSEMHRINRNQKGDFIVT